MKTMHPSTTVTIRGAGGIRINGRPLVEFVPRVFTEWVAMIKSGLFGMPCLYGTATLLNSGSGLAVIPFAGRRGRLHGEHSFRKSIPAWLPLRERTTAVRDDISVDVGFFCRGTGGSRADSVLHARNGAPRG
jgi:hypothetical protein